MARSLRRERDFIGLEFRAHQICFVQNFSQRGGNQTLSINQLSRAFGCPPFRVKAALAKGLESAKVRGRHFAIDEGSEVGILEWIADLNLYGRCKEAFLVIKFAPANKTDQ
jgi:hypothetical protein